MKTLLKIAIGLLVVMVLLQFISAPKNVSVVSDSKSFVKTLNTPKEVESILQKSCFDCHSNNTVYPWYANIQPIEMFLAKHIKEGKEKLNFDELNDLGKRQRRSKFTGIIEQIEQDKMPLNSYLWMHSDAHLSEKDKSVLIQYFETLKVK